MLQDTTFAFEIEETTPAVKAKKNFLNAQQRFRLWKYVEENAEKQKNLTHVELAKEATSALGFPISASSITDARSGVGVHFKRSRGGKGGNLKLGADRTRVVARVLNHVVEDLGIDLPADLQRNLALLCRGEPVRKFA